MTQTEAPRSSRKPSRRWYWLLLLPVAAGLIFLAQPGLPDTVPTKAGTVKVETVAKGLDHPWGLAFLPDGDMLVTEKSGTLRRVAKDGTLSKPLAGVPEVAAKKQGGLLDVAIDPDFARNGFVYTVSVARSPHPHHQVTRFTAIGDRADPDHTVVLFEGDDQRTLGGKVPAMIMMDAGLLTCGNALAVLAIQSGIPMLLVVGYSGGLGERYFMHTPLGPVVEPTLRALSIVYTVAERADCVSDQIARAQTLAQSAKRPVAVLLDDECLRQ